MNLQKKIAQNFKLQLAEEASEGLLRMQYNASRYRNAANRCFVSYETAAAVSDAVENRPCGSPDYCRRRCSARATGVA